MHKANERITELFRTYLERWRNQIQPQNIDLAVFILGRTVDLLCHAAVIEHPHLLSNNQFETEISNLLLAYLIKRPD